MSQKVMANDANEQAWQSFTHPLWHCSTANAGSACS